jgi:hypothetical protein
MSTLKDQLEGAIVLQDKRSASIERAAQDNNALLSLVERFASNHDLDPVKAEKLIDIFITGQRRMLEMSDEQAFAHAMADFKKTPPDVIKSKVAKMVKDGRKLYSYNFADLDAYASAAQVGLAERGITWSFPFSEDDKGVITVSCILRYGLYQHTPTTMRAPADQTGGKNFIQAKASTLTYLERYTFCGATGLTAGMPDNDAAKITPAEADSCMEVGFAADLKSLIEGSGDHDELRRNYFKARDAAAAAKDVKATEVFANAKNIRLGQLNRAKGASRANRDNRTRCA